MKPQIIAGTFGQEMAERLARARSPAVILDVTSRFAVRSIGGKVFYVYFTPTLFRVVLLLAAAPYRIDKEQMMDQLYGEREDGGADSTAICSVYICLTRRKLSPLGLSIKNESGFGWELA